MSTVIVFPELDSIKSNSTKFLIEKIGFNIKPKEPKFDKKDELWRVPCEAIVPNYISHRGECGKTFVYFFEDVGDLIYKKIDNNLKLISYPLRSEIEKDISNRFLYLTKEIENELLVYGENSWGKLTLLKNYLYPLYSMISQLLDEETLSINLINTERKFKFFRLLIKSGYLEIDKDNENIFVESNLLKKFKEQLYKNYQNYELIDLTDHIVGKIFSMYYNEIKDDLHINPPTTYVDTTKAYYFDALRYGDIIKITSKDILNTINSFDKSVYKIEDINYKRALTELVKTSLLNKKDEYYYGNEEIYNKLYGLRENLLTGAELS